ncbi:MAG: desulfoferrodoxin [Clostridiales bacterium]|jgi:superoxide reductase|nr:desulfoferrodoxin [Clostridiales bacterium]
MQVRVYRCRHCGNIAIKLVDSGVPMTCCGEAMEELSPASVEASVEKHVPVVTRDGDKVTVDVGSVAHPMTAEHYIQFVILETTAGAQIAKLTPDADPQAVFAVLPGAEVKKAYAYCNLHGLWADA